MSSTVEKWRAAFPGVEVRPFFRLGKNKLVDSYARDIHYHILHRALFTRERTKHFADTGEYCKLCRTRGRYNVENVEHVFGYCPRAQSLWETVSRLLAKLDGRAITVEDKIFGVFVADKEISGIYNMLIQSAQAAIWRARNTLEFKNEKVCVITRFHRILSSTAWRLYLNQSRDFSLIVQARIIMFHGGRITHM